jgi:hypothetical protein
MTETVHFRVENPENNAGSWKKTMIPAAGRRERRGTQASEKKWTPTAPTLFF